MPRAPFPATCCETGERHKLLAKHQRQNKLGEISDCLPQAGKYRAKLPSLCQLHGIQSQPFENGFPEILRPSHPQTLRPPSPQTLRPSNPSDRPSNPQTLHLPFRKAPGLPGANQRSAPPHNSAIGDRRSARACCCPRPRPLRRFAARRCGGHQPTPRGANDSRIRFLLLTSGERSNPTGRLRKLARDIQGKSCFLGRQGHWLKGRPTGNSYDKL